MVIQFHYKKDNLKLCENMKDTCTFKSKLLDKIHKINKTYNCNSKNGSLYDRMLE